MVNMINNTIFIEINLCFFLGGDWLLPSVPNYPEIVLEPPSFKL
jgi:hypothetical protein